MFSAAKDALTGATLRKYLGGRIERYGSVRDLRIDSKARTFEIVCDLKGEAEPVRVRVGRYEIERRDGKDFLLPTACTCNRPWITHLLEDFVEGQSFEVPNWARVAL